MKTFIYGLITLIAYVVSIPLTIVVIAIGMAKRNTNAIHKHIKDL